MREFRWTKLEEFSNTDELPVTLEDGPVIIIVGGVSATGVHGRLSRTFCLDSYSVRISYIAGIP